MSADDRTSRTFSLRRWSQLKREAARAVTEPATPSAITPVPPSAVAPAPSTEAHAHQSTADVHAEAHADAPVLPPIESLTIDSDFTAFLKPKVDEALKRKALRQLFRDPRFNVMDGLDVYIDDYSQPDPISPEIVRQMVQGRYIFDPPKTRVNEQGTVEDVPPEVAIAQSAATEPEALPAPVPAPSVTPRIDLAAGDAAASATARDAGVAVGPEKPEPAPR